MTRLYNEQFSCRHCSKTSDKQSPFKRWVRACQLLESSEGYTLYDADLINHRYMVGYNRECQYIMIVELKCFGAFPTPAQADTLSLLDQFLRNDRKTPTKVRQLHVSGVPTQVLSKLNRRWLCVRAFGTHILRLQNDSPISSAWMEWDGKRITKDQLIKILKFELHPDTLQPMDLRSHHVRQPSLFERK